MPDKVRAPGYSLFLAALGPLDRDSPPLRRIEFMQAGLGVLSVWFAYLLARRFLTWPWATVAALLLAISPHLAVISTYIISESLFYFLLLAALLASVRAAERRSSRWALFAGAVWGASALVRPTTMFLPPLMLLFALQPAWRARWLPMAALVLAGFIAVFAAWPLRNLQVPDRPGEPVLAANFLLHGSYPNFRFHDESSSYGRP